MGLRHYECQNCKHIWETNTLPNEESIICPKCKSRIIDDAISCHRKFNRNI